MSLDKIGVTSNEKRGITVAGNLITDIVKNIDGYPSIGMLANISSVSKAVGGCAANTAIDLSKIDRSLQISVAGCIGEDEYGRFILSELETNAIDTGRIRRTNEAPTSFSDVMSMPSGERTFFHARGANALFCPDDIDVSGLSCSILHIGYILLLDRFDRSDDEYGTVMARCLKQVREQGIKTSIDVVSESSADYPSKIIPALKYSNYVIINEIECCNIWGINPRKEDGSLDVTAIETALRKTMDCGVEDKVIVHSKEAGFCLSRDGAFAVVPSLKIPSEEIKGSVGAGDAFCAGSLYGIYNNFSDREILEFASAAAACNLFSENAVDGMRSYPEICNLAKTYPRRDM